MNFIAVATEGGAGTGPIFPRGARSPALPQGFGPDVDPETEKFDRRKVALELIEDGKVEELIVWEDAKNGGDPEQLRAYLKAFPGGHFAADARRMIDAGPPTKNRPE